MLVVLGIVAIEPAKTQDPRPKTQDSLCIVSSKSIDRCKDSKNRVVHLDWSLFSTKKGRLTSPKRLAFAGFIICY
nr:hypothetical protein BCV43_12290 [Vibrio cyclitrophicus]PMG87124.1 hypothetical protein BCU82_11900 [Vibrio cyclitrophicus]